MYDEGSSLQFKDGEKVYYDLDSGEPMNKRTAFSSTWKGSTVPFYENFVLDDLDDNPCNLEFESAKNDVKFNKENIVNNNLIQKESVAKNKIIQKKSEILSASTSNQENISVEKESENQTVNTNNQDKSIEKESEDLRASLSNQEDELVETESENQSVNTSKKKNELVEKESDTFFRNFICFLKQDADGKLVFLHFKTHNCLDKDSRAILVRTIIKKFKEDALQDVPAGKKLTKFYISTKVLAEISKAIEKIFPGEAACTYFTPYKCENGTTFQTSGALWSHYQYIIGSLRKKGLLEPIKKDSTSPTVLLSSTNNKELVTVARRNLENGLHLDTLLHDWIITFYDRKALLSIDKLSVSEYINKFPCLKTEHAQQLIEEDFKKLQTEGRSSIFHSRWPFIKPVIIKQLQLYANKIVNLKRKGVNAVHDLALIKLLPALSCDQQDAVVLHLLQLIINCASPSGRKKKDGTSEEIKKYDLVEIRQSFIHNVKIVADLETEIESSKNKCLLRKETFQPTVFVVGDLTAVSEAYVVLDNQQYKCLSTLDALDFTFKLFFALDCSYPKPAYRLWQFIQIAGFDIPDDKANKSVKELVGFITEALKTPKK